MFNLGPVVSMPTPGQSLTEAPENTPLEKPPVFSNPEDFLEHTWDELSKPDKAADLMLLFEKYPERMTAEFIARGVLAQAVANGKITIDAALYISLPMLGIIVTTLYSAGLDNFKIKNDRQAPLVEFLADAVRSDAESIPEELEL